MLESSHDKADMVVQGEADSNSHHDTQGGSEFWH